jgi:peroxiredoxin
MGQVRGLPTDADRAKLVLEVVAEIRALPAGMSKLSPSYGLANLVTEGDLGKEALSAAASTLALALTENQGSAAFYYLELAKLVRYEHLAPLPADPSVDAATALLELHDLVVQESGFSLAALDGKTYDLAALRGKVVLLNFWATWCRPCRREMPDMEKLYRRFSSKGLVVLAVSDETREKVEDFLKKQNYTFAVLLDPDRQVNKAFGIEGIPNSFLYDRQGKLVAQSIDMRTERQFLEMFQAAGLR